MKSLLLTLTVCFIFLNSFSQSTYELIGKADELVKSQHYDEAIRVYSDAIILDSIDADLYYKRGLAYFYSGQDANAILDYNRALILVPDNPNLYFMKAKAEGFMGDYNGAISDYAKVIELDSNYVQAYVQRAYAFLSTKQNMAAYVFFTKAINKDPNQPAHVYHARGFTFQENGAYQQALDDYKKAIELDPNFAEAHRNSGICYYALKDYSNALNSYAIAEKLQPNNSMIYYTRGFVYLDTGFKDKACEEWNKALQMGNTSVQKYIGQHCEKE